MSTWFHRECFFAKNRPTSITDLENFDNIRWEDQNSLKSRIESPTTSSSSKDCKNNNLKRSLRAIQPEFSIELAVSNRSKCVGRDTPILKNLARIGKLDTESELGARYEGIVRWYHPECFLELRESLNFFASGDTISGFQALPEDTKLAIINQLPAIDAPNEPPPTKKAKPDPLDEKKEQKIKEQNEKLFDLHDQLATLKKGDLKILLLYNNQHQPKGESEMLTALSDALLFGALKPCKKCSGGFQLVSGVGYKCQGAFSEWTKCDEVTQLPERMAFEIPQEFRDKIPFLADYEPTVGHRILRTVASSDVSVLPPQVEPSGSLVDPRPMPLKGMQFFIAGKKPRDKDNLRRDIMRLGGQVVMKVQRNLAAVITEPGICMVYHKCFEEAEKYDIQVVTENFVAEAKDCKVPPISLIYRRNIADWGGDIATRIGIDSESSSTGKSSSRKIELEARGGGIVDPDSGLQKVTHVYEEGENKYSVTLVNTDIQSEKSSFYKIQVLRHNSQRKFYLFRSWRKMGMETKEKMVDNISRQNSIFVFKKLYEEKTGNSYDSRDSVKKKPGKMYPMDITGGQDGDEHSG
ncbi:poly [ADP-ribose] polymerase-like isoform X2 [Diachasmimorpha longicaudata]